jgi:hypothetical protein
VAPAGSTPIARDVFTADAVAALEGEPVAAPRGGDAADDDLGSTRSAGRGAPSTSGRGVTLSATGPRRGARTAGISESHSITKTPCVGGRRLLTAPPMVTGGARLSMGPWHGGHRGVRHSGTHQDGPAIGKNGTPFAFSMNAPAPGTRLKVKSLAADAGSYGSPMEFVKLLGHDGELQRKQEAYGVLLPD